MQGGRVQFREKRSSEEGDSDPNSDAEGKGKTYRNANENVNGLLLRIFLVTTVGKLKIMITGRTFKLNLSAV
jgi:hypothetical protein